MSLGSLGATTHISRPEFPARADVSHAASGSLAGPPFHSKLPSFQRHLLPTNANLSKAASRRLRESTHDGQTVYTGGGNRHATDPTRVPTFHEGPGSHGKCLLLYMIHLIYTASTGGGGGGAAAAAAAAAASTAANAHVP